MFAPVINDISTDLVNPPAFVVGNIGPLPESFKPQIQAYYTSLAPLTVSTPVSDVFDAALAVAKETTRWEVTHEDKQAGIIQGVATTFLLRFKDDFVIRVADMDGQTKVDMRSKSRLGKGDMGANAYRIEAFISALSSKLGAGAS